MKRYDTIIIGTGQSGPPLARALAEKGQKVAIAEGHRIGGSCVNYGCIPTKTIIASARAAHMARRGADFGVKTGPVEIDFARVMERKTERVHSAHSGLADWLRNTDDIDLYEVYAGFEGTEGGFHRVRVGDEVIEAPHVYVNTGTRANIPPIPGLDTVDYMDNEKILALEALPEHLVIIGGSYIGLEMGQAFRRFGSKVTIIEASASIISREDEDIRQIIAEVLTDEGITLLTERKVTETSQADSGQISITMEKPDGGREVVTGSHLLVAVGRLPNTPKLNLESVGVEMDKKEFIVVDDHLQTSVPGIWALGDVNGRGAFTHTSYQDYEIALDNINGGTRSLKERIMAYALYIDPPLGRVGMSEHEARESGRPVLMATKPMSSIGRALEQAETYGMIKLLVDAETEQFLGAAVLGYHGDDVIQIISYFMYTGASYKVMQNALPIHPTIGEFLPTILGELQPLE